MPRIAIRFGFAAIIVAGATAGIIFAVFEILAAAYLMGSAAVAMPLRMIAAIVLGGEALAPSYSLAVAATVGMAVHLILSIAFTALFATMVAPIRKVTRGELLTHGDNLAIAGIAFGAVLWIMNFYVVAPLAGWTWFVERTDPIVQLLAHAMFFGCPMGWMLTGSRTAIKIE